jgi:peptidylprolyl isomerase
VETAEVIFSATFTLKSATLLISSYYLDINSNLRIQLKGSEMKLRNTALLAITALSLASLAACGGGEKKVEGTTVTTPGMPTVTANAGEAPTIGKPSGTPPTTLVKQDIIVGNGAEANENSVVTVHYTLMPWSTGSVVESSWTSGTPYTNSIQSLISGWIVGIPGMKVGGRRLLVIPPDLGYGAMGSGPIPPNETLIFAIDLLAVS